jgi:hypothetical protein
MAGEWVAIDLSLESKPEVLRLVTRTGVSMETAVYRLWKLWGWFSLNSEDGSASITPELLSMVCGGDAAWWRAVEAVGWITFEDETEQARLPGWDERFSKAAKARLLNARRQAAYRNKNEEIPEDSCSNATVTHDRYATVTHRNGVATLDRGDRGEETSGSTTTAREAPREPKPEPEPEPPAAADARWAALREAWRAGAGEPWRSNRAPKQAATRLVGAAGAEWLRTALEAIPRLAACKYFRTPVGLPQFCADGFADSVLAGAYDRVSPPPQRGAAIGRPDDKPPPREWEGADRQAFEATKRKLAEQIRSA